MSQLVVFDFDWSLLDADSDCWVIEKLGAGNIFKEVLKRRKELGWTKCIDQTLKTAHTSLNYTKQQLLEACWSVPIHPSIIQAVKLLKESGNNQLYILSDANTVFIETILQHHNLEDAFDGIYTNKGWFDDDNALRVEAYCKDSHSCPLCPSNLCKGEIMEDLLKEVEYSKVVYVGDGSGDFCPCMKLRPKDIILARSYYPGQESTQCPLLAKLRQAGLNCLQNGATVDLRVDCTTSPTNKKFPILYSWKDQSILSEMLSCL